jgi:hypothetical protein
MSRPIIALKYLKKNFIFDLVSTVPLFIFFYQIPLEAIIVRFITALNFVKLLILNDILDRLAVYFSFEKNLKNVVDLFKLALIIITVMHFFACFWHGLAVYEIEFL